MNIGRPLGPLLFNSPHKSSGATSESIFLTMFWWAEADKEWKHQNNGTGNRESDQDQIDIAPLKDEEQGITACIAHRNLNYIRDH